MSDATQHEREEIFSRRIRAGKRTYYFDVKSTKGNDFFITITESKRHRMDEAAAIKNKIFLYKEDFHKFSDALQETIGFIKSNLLPEYDFDEYARRDRDPDASEGF